MKYLVCKDAWFDSGALRMSFDAASINFEDWSKTYITRINNIGWVEVEYLATVKDEAVFEVKRLLHESSLTHEEKQKSFILMHSATLKSSKS